MGMNDLLRAANKANAVCEMDDDVIPELYKGYYTGEFGHCKYDDRMYELKEDRFVSSKIYGEIEHNDPLPEKRYFLHYIESSGMKPVLPKGYKSCYRMFYGCKRITSLDLSDFDTSDVEDMHGMFHKCESLKQLDLSKLNTSKVTDMGYMFASCKSLTSLDLTNFDTSNVTNMSSIFSWNDNLTVIDMSSFDMSKVVDMSGAFHDCLSLNELYMPPFDTSKLEDTSYMWGGCKLKSVYGDLDDKELLKRLMGRTK